MFYTIMRQPHYPTPTTLDDLRLKRMHQQYAQQTSTSSPKRSPTLRSNGPLNRVLPLVHSPKIRKFLQQHITMVVSRSNDLIDGFRAVDQQLIPLDDMEMMKSINKDLKLIVKSPSGAFSDLARYVAGLGINILYALTSKRAETITTIERMREYQEWKVLWYVLVDPRNRTWYNKSKSSIDLSSLSKKDLDHLAREMEIRGRSKMTRNELTQALQSKMSS